MADLQRRMPPLSVPGCGTRRGTSSIRSDSARNFFAGKVESCASEIHKKHLIATVSPQAFAAARTGC